MITWPWIKKIVAVGDKYPVDLNWKRENVFEYGCDCDHPTYVKSDWFNGTVHNSSWFATEAQKTVIIGGTWYQSATTWIDENQYYCSYKNETKLMQKNGFDFSGSDSDLFFVYWFRPKVDGLNLREVSWNRTVIPTKIDGLEFKCL